MSRRANCAKPSQLLTWRGDCFAKIARNDMEGERLRVHRLSFPQEKRWRGGVTRKGNLMLLQNKSLSIEQATGQKLMLAFKGKDGLSIEVREAIRKYRPAGFTLFRAFNIESPEQVHTLTQTLQQAAREQGLPEI